MSQKNLNSFNCQSTFTVQGKTYTYYSLKQLEKKFPQIQNFPYSLKILLENLLRNEDGRSVTSQQIEALVRWNPNQEPSQEISFTPTRVILQDFTGVPAIADLAAMRDAMAELGGDPEKINPLMPLELVIDHSVQIDFFGTEDALAKNVQKEFERNQERYTFLKWGQGAFKNFKVVPPATGIVHQVNLEYLARVVMTSEDNSPQPPLKIRGGERGSYETLAYPDTVVGTDSHTTMVNGLGVLGWGVGGIEAEAAMLGQPMPLLIPQVLGVELKGSLPEGTTATDLVLTITQMLRKEGVVGKFIEFFGEGLNSLTLADRATISNMSPEFGSTCAIFPIDDQTIDYLRLTGRSQERIDLVKAYAIAQGLFREKKSSSPQFTKTLTISLNDIVPSIAGPKRPQDRVVLKEVKEHFKKVFPQGKKKKEQLSHGSVVIASITSCTNTSNPSVLIGSGLLAKKAVEKGLVVKPWVKTSLAPGSQVVTEYLKQSGLLTFLSDLHFQVVGYGCTTCIGNSGPLSDEIHKTIKDENLVVASVLSGNRNFEGRINPDVKANYLASPPLVVAYALVGHMDWDPYKEPIGNDQKGKPVFLKDIWPAQKEINEVVAGSVQPQMFLQKYSEVFKGDKRWQEIFSPKASRYAWDVKSTYIQHPPFFKKIKTKPEPVTDISQAHVLAMLGDSVTTDHISPAGSIAKDSPAGKYLIEHGVNPYDFNSFGARRGNHEIMMRGTFGNSRLKNFLAAGKEGWWTKHFPTQGVMTIFDASIKYQKEKVPLIVIGGKEYGSGSSRDWAAKGTFMLGIKAVIAESFERIHRSNLIGMGVLPLQFKLGESRETLKLTGEETYSITGIQDYLKPGKILKVDSKDPAGKNRSFEVITRIDTPVELEYYQHGGILQFVLRQLMV